MGHYRPAHNAPVASVILTEKGPRGLWVDGFASAPLRPNRSSVGWPRGAQRF